MSSESELFLRAQALVAAGKYGDVIAMRRTLKPKENAAHADLLSWAYVMKGKALKFHALTKKGATAERLFKNAYEKHAAALKIKPDYHDALRYWGDALSDQAHYFKTGAAADRLFNQAGEKYAAALKIKPDMHVALVQGTTHPRLRPFFMAAIIRPMPSANYG